MTDAPSDSAEVAEIVRAVTRRPKYRHVCCDFVARLASSERAKRRSAREAVKAVKNRLHQVAGAFLEGSREYGTWARELCAIQADDEGRMRDACRRILERHASTRERSPLLERFYAEIFEDVRPLGSVLDLACGLNPLTIPWMGLDPGTEYAALDVHEDLASFLQDCFAAFPVRGRAEVRDLIHDPPAARADAALFLKALPCFDAVDGGAGWRLLETVRAKHFFVSFPVRSLGGRVKGMREHHAERFEESAAGRGLPFLRFDFPSELVYRIDNRKV